MGVIGRRLSISSLCHLRCLVVTSGADADRLCDLSISIVTISPDRIHLLQALISTFVAISIIDLRLRLAQPISYWRCPFRIHPTRRFTISILHTHIPSSSQSSCSLLHLRSTNLTQPSTKKSTYLKKRPNNTQNNNRKRRDDNATNVVLAFIHNFSSPYPILHPSCLLPSHSHWSETPK